MKFKIASLLMALLIYPAVAQHQHNQTPYASMQERSLKALSEQQISDLRMGRGMGFALAGELNGYPGPLHVIELADKLDLTDTQRRQVQTLFEMMKAESISIGETLIAQESALDREFAERRITPASLVSLTSDIGQTQAHLRAVHLKYHLTTAKLLSVDQKNRYGILRGYR